MLAAVMPHERPLLLPAEVDSNSASVNGYPQTTPRIAPMNYKTM